MGGGENAAKLEARTALGFAKVGVAVLRFLQVTRTEMDYAQFAWAIGLLAEGGCWQPWHRKQIREILWLIAAAEDHAPKGVEPLQFERILTEDGIPETRFRKSIDNVPARDRPPIVDDDDERMRAVLGVISVAFRN